MPERSATDIISHIRKEVTDLQGKFDDTLLAFDQVTPPDPTGLSLLARHIFEIAMAHPTMFILLVAKIRLEVDIATQHGARFRFQIGTNPQKLVTSGEELDSLAQSLVDEAP